MSILCNPIAQEVVATISTKEVRRSDWHVWLALGALHTVESIAKEAHRPTRRKLIAVLARQVRAMRQNERG